MSSLPLQFVLLGLAGWMTRDQQRVTEYLLAKNAVLREQLRGRRIRYTDAQRRRLAMAVKKLGRKALKQLDTLVTPDTCCAGIDDSSPRNTTELSDAASGYTRIRGALHNLGHDIARNTIKRMFHSRGGHLDRPGPVPCLVRDRFGHPPR